MIKNTFISSIDEFENWQSANLNGKFVDFYISSDTVYVNMYGLDDDTVDIIEGGISNLELFSKKV